MTRTTRLLLLAVCVLTATGCYTTHTVFPGAPGAILGPERTERQWFTIAGLVNLSSPTEVNCPNGLAVVDSEQSFVDGLISVGLSVGGMLLASAACTEGADPATCSGAMSAGSTLPPLLLGSRTVRYRCNVVKP